MNFHKMYTSCKVEAFNKAIELAESRVRCKLYKENGVWVVERN